MPHDPADYDDDPEFVAGRGSPLPPEDRIWRHPSELGTPLGASLTGRYRRGLSSAPTRAGSLSAGLAGALLATGLVLVGTHLVSAMGPTASTTPAGREPVHAAGPMMTTSSLQQTFSAASHTQSLVAGNVGRDLAQAAEHIYDGTVLVQTTAGGSTVESAGLVIGADCLVVAPASVATDGADLDLTLPDGKLVAAQVVGVDAATGLAVLRCDETGMATIPDDVAPADAHEMVVLVFNAPHAIGMSVGLVTATDQRVDAGGDTPLIDEIETDIPPSDMGSALVDGDGEVLGVVVGSVGGESVATPTWLALSVARQIAASSRPGRAWLGISGGDVTSGGQPAGVRVLTVQPGSAAARAGIEPGDVIRSVDGHGTTSLPALQAQLYCLSPGSAAAIGVVRGARSFVEKAHLGTAPAA